MTFKSLVFSPLLTYCTLILNLESLEPWGLNAAQIQRQHLCLHVRNLRQKRKDLLERDIQRYFGK